ncbi:unnamed protein product, partial [Porites evermanni]
SVTNGHRPAGGLVRPLRRHCHSRGGSERYERQERRQGHPFSDSPETVRPLGSSPNLQQILIKLVATKEEAEVAKRLRGEVLEFAPLEAMKRAEHREIRWISLDRDPSSERMTNSKKCLSDVCSIFRGETPVSMSDLSFRDPDSFKSGELRTCIDLWKDILEGYDQVENVLEWIGKGVNIREFMSPFRGSFMVVNYNSTDPPSRAFKNHHSCKQFSQFVTETLLQYIETGAIRVWGR